MVEANDKGGEGETDQTEGTRIGNSEEGRVVDLRDGATVRLHREWAIVRLDVVAVEGMVTVSGSTGDMLVGVVLVLLSIGCRGRRRIGGHVCYGKRILVYTVDTWKQQEARNGTK